MIEEKAPRIALLGFSIECNRFAPVTLEQDFANRTLLRSGAIIEDARSDAPHMLGELPGFIAQMDTAGDWQPVPILLAMTEPGGPVEQAFFDRLLGEWEAGLRSAGALDGVYCVMHGAGLCTEDDDPEGTIQALVREIVGASVPIVASFDLHANVSDKDIRTIDAFVGYRTNPHMDMRERGAESARILRRLMAGLETTIAKVRLPIVPPTVTMLTASDVPNRPYGELIDLGQSLMHQPPYEGRIVNVSVMGGFVYADTAFNGLTAVVTATEQDAASSLAMALARAGWDRREQFKVHLSSLADAVSLALATRDRARPALIFADVADNPGGGGRGNTMHILEAMHAGGVTDALVGVINDAALAREAHTLGEGATFTARFNRHLTADTADAPFTQPFACEATVRCLHPGPVRCRRGIFANGSIDLGPSAALQCAGLSVVVVSRRVQCADPAFLEAFGLDIASARVVVVKSRGHFRGGFDEYFSHEQVVEVDTPGLTSPLLGNFVWRNLPRPVVPLDPSQTVFFPPRHV